MSCKDEEFVKYMERKWSDHEDMSRVLTYQELMEFALKKYQTSLEQGTWGVDSKQTKSIMSLAAKVGTINKWKKDQAKSKEDDKKKKQTDKKDFLPIEEYRKKQYAEAPKWMKKQPKDLKATKDVKGKVYHWCTHHKMWQQHTSDQCRIVQKKDNDEEKSKSSDEKKKKKNEGGDEKGGKVKYKAVNMAAEVDDESEDEDF
jgi:hypothetical protein